MAGTRTRGAVREPDVTRISASLHRGQPDLVPHKRSRCRSLVPRREGTAETLFRDGKELPVNEPRPKPTPGSAARHGFGR